MWSRIDDHLLKYNRKPHVCAFMMYLRWVVAQRANYLGLLDQQFRASDASVAERVMKLLGIKSILKDEITEVQTPLCSMCTTVPNKCTLAHSCVSPIRMHA